MTAETFRLSTEEAQVLNIEELVKHNKKLTLKLRISETEVAQLHLEFERVEGENLALVVKLEDANNEIGRLDMVLRHRLDSLESLNRR